MKVFITGGTGFVGTQLAGVLVNRGHQVTVLDRDVGRDRPLPDGVLRLAGDSTQQGPWQRVLSEHDAVVNLAGTSIFRRWTPTVKQALYDSRIVTTRNVVDALALRDGSPAHLLSTSAVGYYGFCGDEVLTEDQPPGSDFLARLAVDWEAEAARATDGNARVVLCRFGIVLGGHGGIAAQLVPLFKRFLGSRLGSGMQWLSWIHIDDLSRALVFLLDHTNIDGPVNCTAPHPVRNREFTATMARAVGKPVILPAPPRFLLKAIKGEFGEVVLRGQRVIPRKLLDAGFEFTYPTIIDALTEVVGPG